MSSSPIRPARRKVLLLGSFAPSLIIFRGPLIAAMAERGHEVFAAAPDIDPDIGRKAGRPRRHAGAGRARPDQPQSGRHLAQRPAAARDRRADRARRDDRLHDQAGRSRSGRRPGRRNPLLRGDDHRLGLRLPRRAPSEAPRHPARRDADVPQGAGGVAARHLPERGRPTRLPPTPPPAGREAELESSTARESISAITRRSRCRRKPPS